MKKALSMFLAIAIIICAVPFSAFTFTANAETVTSGTTGDCTWSLDGTVLTISGEGDMEHYIDGGQLPWGTSITEVDIGNGVKSIGCYAFAYCNSLTSINIPDSVTSIWSGAFYGCTNLANITIPDSVTYILDRAFTNTAYYNDTNNWKDDVLYIDNYLIEAKDTLSGIYTIKDGTKVVVGSAFDYTNIEGVTIPSSITVMGNVAFYGCTKLTEVNISDISAWCNIEFNGYESNPLFYAHNLYLNGELVTEVTIPNNITKIGYHVFSNCSNLTTITIPDSVTKIGNCAFYGCINLTTINIPYGITSIGFNMFAFCNSLTSITIPDSVTNINYYAFQGCTGLKDVWYTGTESNEAEIAIDEGNSNLTDATWHYDACPNAENKEHIFDNTLDTSCNVCGETRDATPLEWTISVDTTGVYALKPNNKYTGSFSAQKITVLDENGGVVKYNDTKGGFPLVKDLKYTVKFNYDCIKDISGTITWSKTQKVKTIFPDTYAGDWYNDSVTYVVGAGIMSGYQNGKFGTSDSIQRQDFLVMLARYEGVDLDEYSYKSRFSDVARNSYYEAAVNWGVEKGITTGYDNGKFGVGDKMTREQLVTFLYRYAKYKGVDVSYTTTQKNAVNRQYTDFKNVSPFSQDAIIWAVSNGVIGGKTPTTVVPQGNAQRCEVAKIMYNIYLNDIF